MQQQHRRASASDDAHEVLAAGEVDDRPGGMIDRRLGSLAGGAAAETAA